MSLLLVNHLTFHGNVDVVLLRFVCHASPVCFPIVNFVFFSVAILANGVRTNSTIPEETKFQLYKDRTAAQVKVPLATPEIVEFNEYLATKPISSSNESSSDERLSTGLQRKVSDRKIKRIRAKQNDVTESASSNEILKKLASDDDVLHDEADEEKQNQKKKRRPSSKRRKKFFTDQTQTDSGIDSRMGSSPPPVVQTRGNPFV